MQHRDHLEGERAPSGEFVKDLHYEVHDERPLSCCVDGRVDESGELAPAARPGADAGDFMVSLAALRHLGVASIDEIRPKIFDVVVAAAGGPERFRFHTDTHTAHELEGAPAEKSVARGCGHLKQAEKTPEDYGLAPNDMDAIFAELAALRGKGAKEVVLQGSHGERAVYVVDSPKIGLRHGDSSGAQAFVYQAALHGARLGDLAHKLVDIPELRAAGIDEEALGNALAVMSERQRNETLGRLAKGLPIYVVKEGESEATPMDRVQ